MAPNPGAYHGSQPPISNPSDSHQANIISCAVVTWAFAVVFVGLRFYTRRCILRVLEPSDWVILFSLALSTAHSAAQITAAAFGAGHHLPDIPRNNIPAIKLAAWLEMLMYSLSLIATKVSILLLYIRILVFQQARYAAYALLVMVAIFGVWTVCVTFTACIPLKAYWDFFAITPIYCQPPAVWLTNTGLHVATDFLIFILPIPVIFTLKVPWKQKLLTFVIFGLGFFACLTSIFRLWANTQEETIADPSYDGAARPYWSCLEVNVAIVCACLLTLKPMAMRWFPGLVALPEPPTTGWSDYDYGTGIPTGSNRRPLTIGSRPVRNLSGGKDKHDSWIVFPGRVSRADGRPLPMLDLETQSTTHFVPKTPPPVHFAPVSPATSTTSLCGQTLPLQHQHSDTDLASTSFYIDADDGD